MPSFLSEAEKAQLSSEFNNLHETFGRNVIIYKTPERVDIITNEDYISAYRGYRQGNNLQYDTVPVSGTFLMRIKWLDPRSEESLPIENVVAGQLCRLKMQKDAYNFLSGCQSFYVDDIACETVGVPRLHGLFNVNFYTVYAKRREMQ